MYREHVLASRPFSYFTLSGVDGNVDLLGRAPDFAMGSEVYYSNMADGEWHQPHVPGYAGSEVSNADYIPARSFGIQGTEQRVFSYHFWIDLIFGDSPGIAANPVTIVDQAAKNILIMNGSSIALEFRSVDPTLTVSLSYYTDDIWDTKHIGVVWAGNSATLFVNGVAVDYATVPSEFVFSNTSGGNEFGLTGPAMSHFAFYDRVVSDEEMAGFYSYLDYSTSHAEACFLDGGDVIEMWGPSSNYTDIVIDDEYDSSGSLNKNIDSRGWFSPLDVDQLVLSSGVLSQDATQTTLSSGQYLSVPAVNYISTGSWAISIETNDDNSRGGNEYLFTILSDTEYLESYVTSGNLLVVKKTLLNSDGTSTSSTYTYDNGVTTNGRIFVFVYVNGKLYVKSGATGTVLNTVSAVDYIETSISVNDNTMLYIGTSGDLTGNPIPVIKNVYVHRNSLGDEVTAGDYDEYQNQYYSRGWWPLFTPHLLRGSSAQRLLAQPYIVEDSMILNSYLINKKSDSSEVQLAGVSGSFTTSSPVTAIPSSVIPYNSTAGVDYDPQLPSISVSHYTNNSADTYASYSPGVKSSIVRLFLDRRVNATGTQSYIDFDGTGACWVPGEQTNALDHSKYSGTFFESGSVGGPVVDPLVDGSTTRYEYRAFEFLAYIDADEQNTGHLLSFYDGSTEYYFRVNPTSELIETNFPTFRINNTTDTDVSYAYDTWIHVYLELPSLVQDRQVYIGKSYNNATYANGMGIKNLAMYDVALTDAQKLDHFQAYLGRVSAAVDVVDSISVAENEPASLYSVNWTSNTIPG